MTPTEAGRADLNGIAAVLLDMDGTLVDSHASVERAWHQWAAEHGVEPAAVLQIAHGSPAEVTVRRVLPDLDGASLAASAARQLELQYDDLSDVVALPGAHELIEVLKQRQLRWAVVTSADRRLAQVRLAAAEISPPTLVTVEDVASGKPDPECYLLAARRLEVRADECLVVEDSEPGVRAGQSAGMRVAALGGLAADIAIGSLTELARMLTP